MYIPVILGRCFGVVCRSWTWLNLAAFTCESAVARLKNILNYHVKLANDFESSLAPQRPQSFPVPKVSPKFSSFKGMREDKKTGGIVSEKAYKQLILLRSFLDGIVRNCSM